jgi:hypothetical protein
MDRHAKIRIVILFAARSTPYFLNLAREQKSLATIALCFHPYFNFSTLFYFTNLYQHNFWGLIISKSKYDKEYVC